MGVGADVCGAGVFAVSLRPQAAEEVAPHAIYGETEWASRSLYAGEGRQLLRPSTLAFLRARTLVGATPASRAEAVAGNVVEAAIRTAKILPPPSGIGGALRLMVVDARGVTPLQPKP